MLDPLQKNIYLNPLSSALMKKPTFKPKMNFNESFDSDQDENNFSYNNISPKKKIKEVRVYDSSGESEDEGSMNGSPKKSYRVPHVSEFLKFQQSKYSRYNSKMMGPSSRHRGNSQDGRDDYVDMSKGYLNKMTANAYSSDHD